MTSQRIRLNDQIIICSYTIYSKRKYTFTHPHTHQTDQDKVGNVLGHNTGLWNLSGTGWLSWSTTASTFGLFKMSLMHTKLI
jgi:hypothetical protein